MNFLCCEWSKKNAPAGSKRAAKVPPGTDLSKYKAMVVAQYDFNASDPSDLSFKAGDILMLENEVPDGTDGWKKALNFRTSGTGLIPLNYVTAKNDSAACDAWYNIGRTEAERKLLIPGVEDGMFILRPSSDHSCLGLSAKFSCNDIIDIKHYKVHFLPTEGAFFIQKDVKFATLDELINCYKTKELDSGGCLTTSRPKVVPPPFNFKEFKIDRSCVELKKQLGRGNFGEVYLAKMKTVTVAVKTCLPTATKEDFMNEAKTMFLLNHPRLVRFLGYCDEPADEPFYLITEYMEKGSLKDFLMSADQNHVNYGECLKIIHQVTAAMSFLEEVDFVHRDLRAANVLVAKDETVKVADFGLTRILRDDSNSEAGIAFPVRWTAPEAMLPGYVPSTKSDVWSFGVLVYEVLTYGKMPYEDLKKEEIRPFLLKGKRLESPAACGFECSEILYQLMLSCWNLDPQERPAFKEIEIDLENQIVQNYGQMYEAEFHFRVED
ncbi:hypothetical protein AAHC03_026983 [Spirometra sp. Aus1]